MRVRLAVLFLLLAVLSLCYVAYGSAIDDFVKALHFSKVGTVSPDMSKFSIVIGNKSITVEIGTAEAYVSNVAAAPILTWSNGTHLEAIFLVNSTYMDGLVEKKLLGFATFFNFPKEDGGFMYALLDKVPAVYTYGWINHTFVLSRYVFTNAEYLRTIMYPYDLNITVIRNLDNTLTLRLVLWDRETGKVLWQRDVKLLLNGQLLKIPSTDWFVPLLVPVEVEKYLGYVKVKTWLILLTPYKLAYVKRYTYFSDVDKLVAESRDTEGLSGIEYGMEMYAKLMNVSIAIAPSPGMSYAKILLDASYYANVSTWHRSPPLGGVYDDYAGFIVYSNITKICTVATYGNYRSTKVCTFTNFFACQEAEYPNFQSAETPRMCGRPPLHRASADLYYNIREVIATVRDVEVPVDPYKIYLTTRPTTLTLTVNTYTRLTYYCGAWVDVGTHVEYLPDITQSKPLRCCMYTWWKYGNYTDIIVGNVTLNITLPYLLPHELRYYKIALIGKLGSLEGIPITVTVTLLPHFEISNITISHRWLQPTNTSTTDITVQVRNLGTGGYAKVCIKSQTSGSETCQKVYIGGFSSTDVTFTVSGLWLSGGSEGNITVSAYVVNEATGVIDDEATLTIYVYWPLFKIVDVTCNGTSIFDIGTIDGVWGGKTVRIDVKVCNYRTSGHVKVVVTDSSGRVLSEYGTVYVPYMSCVVASLVFEIHDTYTWKNYIVKAYDVDQDIVDSSFTLRIRPGSPQYVIEKALTDRDIYRPYDVANVTLIVKNLGKSRSNYTIMILWVSKKEKLLIGSWKFEASVYGGGFEIRQLNFTVPRPLQYPGETGNFTIILVDPLNRRIGKNVTVTIMWPVFKIVNYTHDITVLNGTEYTACVTVKNLGASSTVEARLFMGGQVIGNVTTVVLHGEVRILCVHAVAPAMVGNYTMMWVIYDPYEGRVDDEVTWTLYVMPCPMFKIVNVTPSIVKTSPGTAFTVTACVKNLGAEGDVTLKLVDPNGTVTDTASLHLMTNELKCVDLVGYAPPSPATYVEYRVLTVKQINGKVSIDDVYVLPVYTYRYVPKISIVKVSAPDRASPGTYFTLSITVKNIGNGTASVYASATPPKEATCRCIKCRATLAPGYSTDMVFNCSTPLGPGLYLYRVTVYEEHTGQTLTRDIKIEVAKPAPPIELSYVFVAIGGLAIFALIAVMIAFAAKKKAEIIRERRRKKIEEEKAQEEERREKRTRKPTRRTRRPRRRR